MVQTSGLVEEDSRGDDACKTWNEMDLLLQTDLLQTPPHRAFQVLLAVT